MTKEKVSKLLYTSILRIRLVEEEIAYRYHEGKMRCPTHLSIGQEAVPSALGLCFYENDLAVSTHRGHAHYLGKGGDLNAMIAELYGKKTGCAKGKGGSMHLIDLNVGFMGTSAIVGNSIPIGVGLALASKIDKKNQISCIFLGDAAIEEGSFYESANFAVLKELPVIFICENNLYSVYSPLDVRQPINRPITSLASSIGLKSKMCDGNDPLKTYDILKKSRDEILNGSGPQFIEFSTYRWREHCGPNFDNDLGYRSVEEYEKWKETDPLLKIKNHLIDNDILTKNQLEQIKIKIKNEIDDAFEFAEKSAFPDSRESFLGEYKDSDE